MNQSRIKSKVGRKKKSGIRQAINGKHYEMDKQYTTLARAQKRCDEIKGEITNPFPLIFITWKQVR